MPERHFQCPHCGTILRSQTTSSVFINKCEECRRDQALLECPNKTCRLKVCLYCGRSRNSSRLTGEKTYPIHKYPSTTNSTEDNETSDFNWKRSVICGLLMGVSAFFVYLIFMPSKSTEDMNIKLIRNLQKDFPSQRNETWYHILSVLEKEVPSVKSITFLHGEDKRTPDCLTKKLVSLYSDNANIKSEEVTFSPDEYDGEDYGFALEHCRRIVETFRVFVTDLIEVPGNVARIFHSLCDEVSSDIKPSLFIFTLKVDERTKKLKPMDRAATVLKEAWSDLPDNEIFPLLSRIIKNVVDVVPENKVSCN